MTTPVVIHFDGGARPNPGPSTIGYTIEAKDWTKEGSDHLGKATNNEAEYRALIRELEVASEEGCTKVEARGDLSWS
jgi:Ribonuclease HI